MPNALITLLLLLGGADRPHDVVRTRSGRDPRW